MSDAMPMMEDDVEEKNADETPKSDEKTNEDIMKAIFSLKNGLYKKIDVVQLTITSSVFRMRKTTKLLFTRNDGSTWSPVLSEHVWLHL